MGAAAAGGEAVERSAGLSPSVSASPRQRSFSQQEQEGEDAAPGYLEDVSMSEMTSSAQGFEDVRAMLTPTGAVSRRCEDATADVTPGGAMLTPTGAVSPLLGDDTALEGLAPLLATPDPPPPPSGMRGLATPGGGDIAMFPPDIAMPPPDIATSGGGTPTRASHAGREVLVGTAGLRMLASANTAKRRRSALSSVASPRPPAKLFRGPTVRALALRPEHFRKNFRKPLRKPSTLNPKPCARLLALRGARDC